MVSVYKQRLLQKKRYSSSAENLTNGNLYCLGYFIHLKQEKLEQNSQSCWSCLVPWDQQAPVKMSSLPTGHRDSKRTSCNWKRMAWW